MAVDQISANFNAKGRMTTTCGRTTCKTRFAEGLWKASGGLVEAPCHLWGEPPHGLNQLLRLRAETKKRTATLILLMEECPCQMICKYFLPVDEADSHLRVASDSGRNKCRRPQQC